jgi:hypothetical protein
MKKVIRSKGESWKLDPGYDVRVETYEGLAAHFIIV